MSARREKSTLVKSERKILNSRQPKPLRQAVDVGPLPKEKWREIKSDLVEYHNDDGGLFAKKREIGNALEAVDQLMALGGYSLEWHGYEQVSKNDGYYLCVQSDSLDFQGGYAVREQDGETFAWGTKKPMKFDF